MSDKEYEVTWCTCGNRHGAVLDILPEDMSEMVGAVTKMFNVGLYTGMWIAHSYNPHLVHIEFVSEERYDGRVRRAWEHCGKCISPEIEKHRNLADARAGMARAFFREFSKGDVIFFDAPEKRQVSKQAPAQAQSARKAPEAPRLAGYVSYHNEHGIYIIMGEETVQVLWDKIASRRMSSEYIPTTWFAKGE